MNIKSHCLIENLQPQCAAYLAVAAGTRSIAPAPGDSVLTLNIGTGLKAEQEIAEFFKCSVFRKAKGVSCDRVGSDLEFHANDAAELHAIAGAAGAEKGPDVTVEASMLLEDIAPDYAAMANRSRRGMMVLPGDNLLMIECSPKNRVGELANRIEAGFPRVELVHLDARGGAATLKGSHDLLSNIRRVVIPEKLQ